MSAKSLPIFRYPDFALICFDRFAVTFALQIIAVAIGWYVYDVTNSKLALGYLGLAGIVPAVVLVLATGWAADRFDRRQLMFWANLLFTVTAAALVVLLWTSKGVVWPVYLVVIFASIARAFHNPAAQAMIPNLVPASELGNAIAFSSGSIQAAQIVGPAVGGLLYAIDARLPFIAAGLLFGASAISVILITYKPEKPTQRQLVTFSTLVAGFKYAWDSRVVLGAVSLDMFVVALGAAVHLLPVFAKDVLQVGPEGLGVLRASMSVGAVLMAAWLARNHYVDRGVGAKLFFTITVFGVATILFGLSTSFILSMMLLAVIGAADMISVVIRHTLVQAETPDELRGRVAAVNTLFVTASAELGLLRAGVVAHFIGAIPAVLVGGATVVGIAILWPRLFPALRLRDHLVKPQDAGPATQKDTT